MSDGPDNLVLVYLRRLDEKLDRIPADVQELKVRMPLVEQQAGNLAATQASQYAILSSGMDRMDSRIVRIERRLDLMEPAP